MSEVIGGEYSGSPKNGGIEASNSIKNQEFENL